MTKIYLASPLGFSEAGRLFLYQKLIPKIKKSGFEVIDPWKLTSQEEIDVVSKIEDPAIRKHEFEKLNFIIGERNANGILNSKGIVAILDGIDVDSGVAGEIAYGSARGIPTLGYRNDFRRTGENEGAIVNLQIQYFITSSGGKIIPNLNNLEKDMKEVFLNRKYNI